MSVLQFFLIERIAVIAWIPSAGGSPVNYDYFKYFVSDLGAHLCKEQDAGSSYGRWICSPLFGLMDLSLMVLGIGVILTSLLVTDSVLRVAGHHQAHQQLLAQAEEHLTSNDPLPAVGRPAQLRALGQHIMGEHHGRKITRGQVVTRLFRWSLFVAGWGLLLLGGNPEDFNGTWHTRSTAVFLICAVLALIALGILWWPPSRVVSLAILLCAVVAIIGGAALIITNWLDLQNFERGLYERFVVYGFITGVAIMGCKLAASATSARRVLRAQGVEVRAN